MSHTATPSGTAPSNHTAGHDTLVLDLPAARELAAALASAGDEIAGDQVILRDLLHEASAVLRRDQTAALVPLAVARRGCVVLASDLRARVDLVERTTAKLDRVDDLTHRLDAWPARLDPHAHAALRAERRRVILRLVDGNPDHARRIERALRSGLSAAGAFAAVEDELRLAARVDALMLAFSIDAAAARAMIERVDVALVELLDRGMTQDDAVAALAVVENFGLDLDTALARANDGAGDLMAALGEMLTAGALGVTLGEYDALVALGVHFGALDRARGIGDERVSAADLEFVVDHPWRFTPSQVLAARSLLDEPMLRNRLDTTHAHTELFSGETFGSAEPGDGLISELDLESFLVKAQMHTILGEYADEIDVANDPRGVVDGYHSANDLRAFLADNPELPEPVRESVALALEAGWFDQSWWEAHKDELAMGAALLAAGLVVVATGGGASMLLVVGVGAFAAGATTMTVNLATGAPVLDDVFAHAVKGGFIGAGVHGVVTGTAAFGAASTGVARVAALSGATAGAADVVAGGGLDLVIDEDLEATVHEIADDVSTVAGTADLAHGITEWTTRTPVTFDTIEEQLAALSERISRQKQLRHVRDARLHGHGGYFDDPREAQRVLDAVHDGSADVLAMTTGNDLLVRYDGATGVHVNRRYPERSGVPTSTFLVKGTAKPSIVPARPGRTE